MRLIDADAVKNRLDYCVKEGMGSTIAFTFKHMIDEAPTIDAVSVVHGEWVVSYADGIKQTKCSACGVSFITYDVYGWHYCPWCGAKMKGADDEQTD